MEQREKESLQLVVNLYREGKARVKKLRKQKRAYPSSEVVRRIYTNRKAGVYKTPAHELADIYTALDTPTLSSNERFSLNRRRKVIEKNLTESKE